MKEHAVLISFKAEPIQVFNARNVLLEKVQLVNLLQLLHAHRRLKRVLPILRIEWVARLLHGRVATQGG